MELYIDENGKARDLDECSVNIVCESKEEADKMMEGLTDGRLVMEMKVAVDTCSCDEYGYYLEEFDDFDFIVAWASLPKPYKEET